MMVLWLVLESGGTFNKALKSRGQAKHLGWNLIKLDLLIHI